MALAPMMLLVVLMNALLEVTLAGRAHLLVALKPATGAMDSSALAKTLLEMALASGLMCMIQLWTALAFRSFVPPLSLGIVGTFLSIAAASARAGAYFPWLMPLHVLSSDAHTRFAALDVGALGGVIGLTLMCMHLSRREAT